MGELEDPQTDKQVGGPDAFKVVSPPEAWSAPSSFLLFLAPIVAMPFAPSSVLVPGQEPRS